ncbi:GNAT family N-acetyltransferase [Aquabacterium lacunae]|uniref:GNAT family N-acetyltransferase n=1 Tax=Aquabacterium lacunae TaxID=2528630 RepID=A0A4Q9GY95_9BURK|nr:MSMEG_0567/Sll0786 family nitrogen starvation N-acetyltransferase [Aquabacterium lacunae]TBO31195.1 GNAT family N-acetyltransferase [Aquabacterium lacunae]
MNVDTVPYTTALCELPLTFQPVAFRVQRASQDWAVRDAHALRRAVFCVEQGLFVGDDRDAIDDHAQLLVACTTVAGECDQVVGTVRIHQSGPGVWWGSRLAVHPSFRHVGRIGATLIQLAVSSAHAQGATAFWAHVQQPNVPLFTRLHWARVDDLMLHGRAHARMQADLAHYPPCHAPDWGFMTQWSARHTDTTVTTGASA